MASCRQSSERARRIIPAMRRSTLMLLIGAGALGGAWLMPGVLPPAVAQPADVAPQPPPPPQGESPGPPPNPDAVWIPGHWQWRGGKYEWAAGRWETAPPGSSYVPGRHKKTGPGWVWEPGRWRKP